MTVSKRDFLCFGAKSAAIILTPGLLMPVRKIIVPVMPLRPRLDWGSLTEEQKNYWYRMMLDQVSTMPAVRWQSR